MTAVEAATVSGPARTHQPGDTVQLAWQTIRDPWTITSRHGFIATCTRDSDGIRSQFDVRDLHVIPRKETQP